jgi:hypothetical protein
MTSARTREEVLRLAAQEKAELVSSEESYFSRFGPFLLAVVLERGKPEERGMMRTTESLLFLDAPSSVRTAAAEAMSSLLKLSPSFAGKQEKNDEKKPMI